MSNRKTRRKLTNKNKSPNNSDLTRVYLLTFVVAFCSIVYQLLLAHTISLIAGNAIIWYSITVGVFLGSLGLGSIFSDKISDKNIVRKLFWVEILLAICGALAVSFMHFVQIIDMYFWSHGNARAAFFLILFGSQSIIFSIGFLSGFELPMLMRIANKNSKEKKVTNRVLGVDYFGSLLGAVIFPLLLVPFFRTLEVGFLIALINIFAAVYLYRKFLSKEKNKRKFFVSVSLAIIFCFGFFNSEKIEGHFSKKYYYYPQAVYEFKNIFSSFKDAPEVETYHSAYQKIDIVDEQSFNAADIMMDAYTDKLVFDRDFPIGKELYLNGDWQFNSGTEEIYHEYFAHVPVIITGEVPKNVLVLGGGDGMLTRELLKHQGIEKITQVDIDSEMLRLAKEHQLLIAMNKGAFNSKKVDLRVGDAYAFVRNTNEVFDAIYMDFPMPVDYNTSRLYSREFYSFVNKKLSDDGFIVLDAPGMTSYTKFDENGLQIEEDDKSPWKEYAYTVAAAGFKRVIPYISNLELDNKKAREMTKEYLFGKYKEKPSNEEIEKDIDDLVHSFVFDSQEGFIFAQKKDAGSISFHKPEINTYLLNKKRFLQAFKFSHDPIEGIEWKYVNSVLKPTLPKRNFWQIRFPYYIQ